MVRLHQQLHFIYFRSALQIKSVSNVSNQTRGDIGIYTARCRTFRKMLRGLNLLSRALDVLQSESLGFNIRCRVDAWQRLPVVLYRTTAYREHSR